ncbi:MAG: type II secretion system protein [Fimbriimonas sp.]
MLLTYIPSVAPRRPRAFTLIEVLVVIAIIAVLAGILFPVFARAKEKAKQTTCLSNQRQLGFALNLYTQDNDDKAPSSSPPTLFKGAVPIGMGWAGRVQTYAKSVDVFRCPADGSRPPSTATQTVSYGLNSNLWPTIGLSQSSSASKTVLLFEVLGNHTRLTSPDEGQSGPVTPSTLMSSAGDGTNGGLFSAPMVWTGTGDGRFTLYAMGEVDNAGPATEGDDYKGNVGRHHEGANFLALDGHCVWLPPKAVSGGRTARSASDPQRATGCFFIMPNLDDFRCAAGTGDGKHKMTFSIN